MVQPKTSGLLEINKDCWGMKEDKRKRRHGGGQGEIEGVRGTEGNKGRPRTVGLSILSEFVPNTKQGGAAFRYH